MRCIYTDNKFSPEFIMRNASTLDPDFLVATQDVPLSYLRKYGDLVNYDTVARIEDSIKRKEIASDDVLPTPAADNDDDVLPTPADDDAMNDFLVGLITSSQENKESEVVETNLF